MISESTLSVQRDRSSFALDFHPTERVSLFANYTLEDRMAVLAGLAAVDWVVPFSDDTPLRLIQSVLPAVLVKGGDYRSNEIVGAKDVLQNGGEVRVLAFREGHSSSRIIDKLSD